MVPRGFKSIFGQKKNKKNQNFDQKLIFGQKIKIWIFRPKFAQKWCLEVSNRFLVKKMKISIFRQKIDPGGEKSIFGQKIEISIFRQKFAQKWCLEVSNRFLVKK